MLETLDNRPRLTPLDWATSQAQIVHPARGRIAFAPYDYQAQFLNSSAPRRLILKARQIGYSQVFAIEALYRAIHRAESTILLVSRSQDLAVNLLRYCYQAYNALKAAPGLDKQNESEMGFSNGARIKSIPANRSTGRGFSASDVYLDEFAYAEYADDIYQSVNPALSQGGTLTIASTPNGKGNLFHRLWVGGDSFEKQRIDWRQCPRYWTDDEKAAGVPAEESKWYLEHRLDYTAAAWAAEFDCDFDISGGSVFRRVRECIRPVDLAEHGDHTIAAGIDFAQASDYTVVSIVCADCKQQIAVDRFNRVEWAIARDRIKALTERYRISNILAEQNSIGGPNIEALQAAGLPVSSFETTATSKPPLIQALALALEQGVIGLLDYTPQTLELEAYEGHRNTNTGHMSYSAPPGAHDDTVMALALAWNASSNSGNLYWAI